MVERNPVRRVKRDWLGRVTGLEFYPGGPRVVAVREREEVLARQVGKAGVELGKIFWREAQRGTGKRRKRKSL